MAGLVFDHVSKKFGTVTAVNDLSIQIQDKEFLVLVGPSGCGKTTALRMIAGLEEVTAGNVFIGDRIVNDVSPKDRDIAMVFQSYALYPHMNVYDNMAFGLKMRKIAKAEIDRRVKEAASILGIEVLLERKPKQLSGGRGQRVALGRANNARACGVLDGRAPVQPGCEAARCYSGRADQASPAPSDYHRLCDARPGRGDDDGHTDSGDEGWDPPAARHPPGALRTPRQHLRGRLHFIRSPAMNFFPVAATPVDGKVELRGEGFQTSLPEVLFRELLPFRDKKLIMEIRPEQLGRVGAGESETMGELPASVEVVESMGSEQYVYANVGGRSFVARLDADVSVRMGDRVRFGFPMSQVQLFDADTERRILGR